MVVLTEEMKGLASNESGKLVKATMEAKREKDGSEDVIVDAATSEAPDRSNYTFHNTSEKWNRSNKYL